MCIANRCLRPFGSALPPIEVSTEMARATNSSLQEMLDQAVEYQRRRLLLEGANHAYAKLRESKAVSTKWEAELRRLDGTVGDGI